MHPIDQQLNHMLRGEFDKAWLISEAIEAQEPNNQRHQFNRGWFLLHQGKFQEGCKLLEAGRYLNVYGSPPLGTGTPIWNPAEHDLKGKTIILALEGGLGDEIIHVRFATTLAEYGATVIVYAHHSLHCLIQRIKGVSKVITHSEIKTTRHDYWIPGFSAGWLLGYEYDTMINDPYITPHPQSVELWKNIINSDKLKVGIRWSGSPQFEHQQFRQFPVEPLLDLAKYENVQLYSLQCNNDTRELPSEIVDLQHLLLSWEDTAAAMENMDLIITSCTSVAHVAAAMGKPTWVITPILPYHTWTYGDRTSPWYKTVRLYRQQKFADWSGTFNLLHKEFVDVFDLTLKSDVEKPNYTYTPVVERTPYHKKVVVFAGLPNSGNTLITNVLTQDKNIVCQADKQFYKTFEALLQTLQLAPSDIKYATLKAFLESYFDKTPARVILLDDVQWIKRLPALSLLLNQDVEIVCPVRSPSEILATYELEHRNAPLDMLPVDIDLENQGSIAARCYHYSGPEGVMGIAHSLLKDAINTKTRERMLFVDYNKFCGQPHDEVARIVSFLQLEEHGYQNTEAVQVELQKVKKHVFNVVEVIGFELFDQYNRQIFWNALT